MEIRRSANRSYEPVDMDDCKGVDIARLFVHDGEGTGPCLREFTLEPVGHTAEHSHPWFHEIIVERGILLLVQGNEVTELHGGDVVFIEPGERHQFRNPCHYPIQFYCLIPGRAD